MTTPAKLAKQMADDLMKTVKGYCAAGLPKVYKNFSSHMSDFYSDLPWDPEGKLLSNTFWILMEIL